MSATGSARCATNEAGRKPSSPQSWGSRGRPDNVETGRVIASLPLALAVARVFGTPVESIFLGDEPH